jgi:membrane protease YdiL (CAAX protease family)
MHAQLFWAVWKGVHYGVLPYLCMRLVLRRGLRAHGVAMPSPRRAWWIVLGATAVIVPLAIVAARVPVFAAAYPKCPGAELSVARLATWEIAYAFQFVMVELFFRGFLIFSLARNMGWLSIFVALVPYAMIHLQKPFAECAGSIATGIFLGAFALRTRSIAGGAVIHCAAGLAMDLAALHGKGLLPHR